MVSGNAFAVSETQVVSQKQSNVTQKTGKQQFFEEISVVEISYQQAEEFSNPLIAFYTSVDTQAFYNNTPTCICTFLPPRDVKKQLEQQVFPFHFFW